MNRGRVVLAAVAALGAGSLVLAACHNHDARTPFVIPSTPLTVVSGNTVMFYSVADVRGTPVLSDFGVTTDLGDNWTIATPANGTPPQNLVIAHPAGAPSYFYWNSFADLGPGFHRNVVFAPSSSGGPAQTLPFDA